MSAQLWLGVFCNMDTGNKISDLNMFSPEWHEKVVDGMFGEHKMTPTDTDSELRDMMKRWSKDMDGDCRVQAMQIASTLPNANLAELIDNTERIMKWLEEH